MTNEDNQTFERCVSSGVSLRHHLHRYPELSWQEQQTAARIREQLDQAGIAWRACADTGTIADIGADNGQPRIALRGDIDALPITEANELTYCSEIPGKMHACGHDGHTASLMSTALWLKSQEQRLPQRVRCLFQPAEEGGHGAKRMIEDGALDGVACVYGWHNWPNLAFGKAACPDGVIMAGNGSFRFTINGKGGHGSQPEQCRDPILAGASLVQALQQVVARRTPPQEALVLSVCSFEAPSAVTVIPEQAILQGSFRLSNPNQREPLSQLLAKIADGIARAHAVSIDTEVFPRYHATINHAQPASHYRHALTHVLGSDAMTHKLALPVMASEDFSYYLRECPGAFALIGADDGQDGHGHGLHRNDYDFNDRLIPIVTRVYAQLVGVEAPGAH
jgi:hippurate hydrolase